MEKQLAGIPESLNNYISDGTCEATCRRYASLKQAAQQADYGAFDRNVVVLDTETTGLSFNHDELIQIAAARLVHGEITDWFVTFVNPGKLIPEEIQHLTGITNEDVVDAPSPSEALADLVAFVGDAYVVAHNADFDKHFTTQHPAGFALLDNTWIDSLDLARIALPRMKSHRLLDLVRAFEAPLSTHRADADVEATCVIFRILLAAVEAMPIALIHQIAQMATPVEWPTQVVFDYFDKRYDEEHPVQEEGKLNVDKVFSLKGIRRRATANVFGPPKRDANDVVEDPSGEWFVPTREQISECFTPEGIIGQLYPAFESREEQVSMSCAVADALRTSDNLMVEAGTGVGKSMAYLLPLSLLAKKNNVTVGVATKTNSLLDQLIYHELPALDEALGGLTYAALKGFSHYPCLRKVEKLVQDGVRMKEVAGKEVSQAPAAASLLSFIEQTVYDDIDALKIDYRSVPRWSITTTSHDCLRRKCPFYGTSCFVHGARRQAESADVVVTNHTLLFCDLKADGGLLPTARHWVVDEAHGAEVEARRAFSLSLAAEDIMRTANKVASSEASRNPFIRAERITAKSCGEESLTLLYALSAKAKSAGVDFAESGGEFVRHMKDLLYFDQTKGNKGYEFIELWVNDEIRRSTVFNALTGHGKTMCEHIEKLIKACQDMVAFLEDFSDAASVQREIASLAMGLKEMLTAAETVLGPASELYAYSATLNRRKDRASERLEALVLNVGETLQEKMYQQTHSVIYTSATIAVGDSFKSFESAMGLNAAPESHARSLQLASSYDYDRNMTVYIPSDIPEPNELAYLPALQNLLISVHRAQRGSLLTLFTNRREMESCFEAVNPALKSDDLRLVCQKWGVSVKGLKDEFLSNEHLSLFALKSFWEGFDAPGSTLRGVVIPKLPFAKPTDPLSCERAARDDAAWRRYVLPAAVIETKQAAGRLIRCADDKGILLLADKRLITKSYGKAFLSSLPSKNIKVMTCAEIARDVEANYQG